MKNEPMRQQKQRLNQQNADHGPSLQSRSPSSILARSVFPSRPPNLEPFAPRFDESDNMLHKRAWEAKMDPKRTTPSFGRPVPELPVVDVERAQQHYRDALGFEIGWLYPGKQIGAVLRDGATIFFRKRSLPFEPAVHWIFAEDIDATYRELQSSGAIVAEPLEMKPWGLRQFTVHDLDGNIFYFHNG
jgi:predicted enzyme related to lactoylglutathione lyase